MKNYKQGLNCEEMIPLALNPKSKECICRNCGKRFVPKAPDRNKYCSRECYFESIKAEPKSPKEKPVLACAVCGKHYRGRPTSKYCSDECRRAGNNLQERKRSGEKHKDIVFKCKTCGMVVVAGYADKRRVYCSRKCARKASRKNDKAKGNHRRRARENNVCYESFNPKETFTRDGWICQICGRPVNKKLRSPDPMSASLDHIIPLSCGGAHTMENVQLAHMICNSLKGDRSIMLDPKREGQLMIV